MVETILIADDDSDIRRFVEINLRLEGFETISASDGEEAYKLAIEEGPDLVLMDVMMPGIDGFELCQRLRTDPRTATASIIMLTAKSLSADKVVGLTAGADDYMIKPFDPLELVARVKSTLKRARQMREVNPLTGLPGNAIITQELQRRLETTEPFALMHVDLNDFKAFNDYYGFARGDTVLKLVGKILREASRTHDPRAGFVGHIGGDDFTVLCNAAVIAALAEQVISDFDESIVALYDPQDAARGFITVTDRRGEAHDFPLMTISIGVASTLNRKIESHWEASEIAGELKHFAKREERSAFIVDRRGGAR
jgi:diguanylate cyclase (GGDEF)-like protein